MIIKIILDRQKQNKTTTFLNPASYVEARKKISLYKEIDSIYVDGILLVKLLNIFCNQNVTRKSFDMTSLAPLVFNDAINDSKSIYFIGSTQNSIEGFIDIIKKKYKGLNIIGYRNGYVKGKEDGAIQNIIDLNPDIVVIGMGAPLQEKFLINLRKKGFDGTGYTCGGFIHQTSESLNYYPTWINRLNLRMPYRIFAEPEFRRKLPNYVKFFFYFFKDLIYYYKQK
ncbi:WecB/TagA/CpsF family glycosyltransferase [Flammeovirga sp. EKP202]|uniref:WecB/TagA/CpsF family glycosyltransferase n=1 Tax=Flammeovirga sp. EKP202 TaxID=2770592 RepID=UPI00165FDDAA|nr:WecB/TagA/CpsF family glycosyltransferase [Flammeovirga sp. EKP202]MBD0399850.1 WecB/TagA/CpsF family glycosyltransferase [Flammeovirga sp. EKP202]